MMLKWIPFGGIEFCRFGVWINPMGALGGYAAKITR